MFSVRRLTTWVILGIASIGQIPYWLHHLQCHTENCCAEAECTVIENGATEHSHHTQSHGSSSCGHRHTPSRCQQEKGTSIAVNCAVKYRAQQVVADLSMDRLDSHDHSCQACYYLSQSSQADSSTVLIECENLIEKIHISLESKSLHDALLIYSSRAPPAV